MADIVWLSSYPRSGNTWVRHLLGAYAYGEAPDWGTNNFVVGDPHWEAHHSGRSEGPVEALDRIEAEQVFLPASAFRPRAAVLKTHFPLNPAHPLLDRTIGFVYLIRDPRDVLRSALNYHRLLASLSVSSDAEFAREFIRNLGAETWRKADRFGSWPEHVESWTTPGAIPGIMTRYEDLKRDTAGEFRRILEFLDVPVEETRLSRAVELSSLELMREREVDARARGRFFEAREGFYFINEGRTSQSLEPIAPGLDAEFDGRFGPWLERFGYASEPARPRQGSGEVRGRATNASGTGRCR